MNKKIKRIISRRKKSIKSKLTLGKYPRLVVYRSNIHLYAQLIDDNSAKTLASISTNDKKIKKDVSKLDSKVLKSSFVGEKIGEHIKNMKIKKVIFDRNGYMYHGRVKAFVESVRKTGLNV
ncbi:MAG: 50S ribosomal protein L18 [Candidatus Marinimicrobia bacterium]|nr:50S ribosomal protein L18 [Candidatus Neomarinimicrobiota bacterium]|tara:strand:- start:4824 stop:5186 length:363 start_codon:yes stop_codon:yes gene_type:complete